MIVGYISEQKRWYFCIIGIAAGLIYFFLHGFHVFMLLIPLPFFFKTGVRTFVLDEGGRLVVRKPILGWHFRNAKDISIELNKISKIDFVYSDQILLHWDAGSFVDEVTLSARDGDLRILIDELFLRKPTILIERKNAHKSWLAHVFKTQGFILGGILLFFLVLAGVLYISVYLQRHPL